jgi:hypothetical protein
MQFTTHSLRFANIVSSGISIRMLKMIPSNLPPAMRARFDAAQQIDTSLPNDTYTKAEVDRLIRQAVFDAAHAFTQQDGIRALIAQAAREANTNLVRQFAEKLTDNNEQWQIKFDQLNDRVMGLQGIAKQRAIVIPPLETITKIKIQFFNNKANPGPNYKQTGPSGKAMYRLKLYVWDCPKSAINRYLEGTCGDLWINVYDPTDRQTRRRHGTHLDHLNADDAKLVGALLSADGKERLWDQAAIVMSDNRLYLQVRDDRLDCGCGYEAAPDFAAGAHVRRWYWRPDMTPDYADDN